jgi:hypothetical protein
MNYNLDNFGIDYKKIRNESELDIYVNHKYYIKCGHYDESVLESRGESFNEKLHRMEEGV